MLGYRHQTAPPAFQSNPARGFFAYSDSERRIAVNPIAQSL
jgi:hypothetical protein